MEKKRSNQQELLPACLKGFCIGGTMLVPGVSGGSMAMILGIYDRLITSVSSFRKNKKKNAIFLGMFLVGALLGMALLARPLLGLIEGYPMLMMYFFTGVAAGSVPMIVSKAGVGKKDALYYLWILPGFALMFLFTLIPESIFTLGGGAGDLLLLSAAGILSAAALVLPGISVSYLLLILGLYEPMMKAISSLEFSFLLPLGIGGILGIVFTTKALERAMNQFPRQTYLLILGFMIGSLAEVFPGLPSGGEILYCGAALVAGVGLIRLMTSVSPE